MQKVIKVLDNLIDRVVIVVCLFFFLVGSYALVDTYHIFYNAQDKSLLRFRPDGLETELVRELKGSIAWLTLDDTHVDYPIMQAEDNTYYINRDPYGNYSLSGSIFLDSRNSADFSDSYSLLYGHHMENYFMFGALDKWLEADYWEDHRTGELLLNGKSYDVEIFAIVECDASEQAMFAPNEGYDSFSYIKDNAKFYYEPKYNDHLLAMSTCKYPDSSERTILVTSIDMHHSKGAHPQEDNPIGAPAFR